MLAKKKIVVSVAVLLAILLVGTAIAYASPTTASMKDQHRAYQGDENPGVSIKDQHRAYLGGGNPGVSINEQGYSTEGKAVTSVNPSNIKIPRSYGQIPEPVKEPEEPDESEYTRLLISPGYEWFEMKPGDEEEFTVTVKHNEEESVSTQVHIETPPYCDYCIEKDWITVEPMSAEIAAGVKQDYNVTINIPDDAEKGYYNAQIVFTDDTFQAPYPEPYPKYVNAMDVSVNVWTPPKIYFWPQYISDRVKAGQSYEYVIQLENIGDNAIAINPEIGGEKRWHVPMPYEPEQDNSLDEWMMIEAPASVLANSTATVTVTMNVPEDARGWYTTGINLNIDDPSIEEWDQIVHMNIEVWKQPTTPYSDNFTVEQGETFSVIVTAREYGYDRYGRAEEEPSFNVELSNPSGKKVTPESSKTVKKREVSLGLKYEPWGPYLEDTASEEPYHVGYTRNTAKRTR